MFDLSIQNIQPNFGYFLNVTAIQRFVFGLWHHNRSFFKHVISFKSWFIKVKTKLVENSALYSLPVRWALMIAE